MHTYTHIAVVTFLMASCLHRNALCGKLQCSNIQTSIVFGIQPSIISTSIGGAKCYGVDFRLGSDVPDPGMVDEGTKCGEDMVRTSEGTGGSREKQRGEASIPLLLLWYLGLHEL